MELKMLRRSCRVKEITCLRPSRRIGTWGRGGSLRVQARKRNKEEKGMNEREGCGGAYKEVYIGYDHVEETEIAWNQIVFYGKDEEALKTPEKLFAEATMLMSLNHARVMKCFSYWFDSKSNTLNMITELFPSGSLKKYLPNYDNVDLASIKSWGRQILEGLRFLHSQSPKIIHRDIKCDNVFVDSDGKQVKLGDFGLGVRLMEGNFVKDAKGTPEFMAPDNQMQIFRKVYTGVKPASIGKVKDTRVKDIIEKCLLPVSVRPCAEELLKDPSFLYDNCGSSATLEACAPAASFSSQEPFLFQNL
ncbi:serine/threonine-protein kinase WNK8-like [Lycium ferocissimum]|uniref:serine/threonine-protein kinase WNK8-like n=1 Tax=Lycium ferocissimum TaxID=112874 RepID=UPI002814BC36|nr:serine/threonine-protein kinase WNK8-like [Lycium ferocissimum]